MKIKLEGVLETLFIPLWARAAEAKQSQPIIKDDKAVEIMNEIEYDFAKFNNEWSTQISIVVRTELLDEATKAFTNKHPNAVIINIGCGLDTRFSRLNNGRIYWYDLDLPEVIQIKRSFFEENNRYKMIAKSVFDYSWIDDIKLFNHVLIIAEGLLMYFTEEEVIELMDKLVEMFPSAEMLLETVPPYLVKQSEKYNPFEKQFQIEVQWHWGIKKGKDMEKLNDQIKFVEEWYYYDYHRDRWKSTRWLSLIPSFKNRFSNRIVHLKFG